MLRGLWKWFNNARAVVLAVVVHVVVLGILVVQMEWVDLKPASSPRAPIQAQTVDRQLIEKELARIKQEKKDKQREQAEKEKRRLAEIEKKRKAEAKKKAQAKALKKKKLAEQKQLAEKKRKEEARKKKQAAEAKKKRLAQEKQRLEDERRHKEAQAALLRSLEEEENESKVAQLIGLIAADVQNNWRIPPTARNGMQCVMLIRLLPNGDVQSVQVTKSSGDKAFDRSAEDAVYRASPLPVSASSAGKLFNSHFREFNFRFKPRNL